MDSCAQFLAVAEHRLIPARARSVGHQLRKAGYHSVWALACQNSVPGGHAGVGVVSLGGAPLALPSFVTPLFMDLHATAGEKGIIRLLEVFESEFPPLPNSSHAHNSCLRLSTSACARASCSAGACAGAAARVCPVSSSSAVSAVVHAHATTLHGAHNSWSDTVRSQGPTIRRCTKGVGSGPAEDLRPVSEVEAGVNFRLAGGVRRQVAGSIPRRQPGTGTRCVREGAVTPSLHPEVPSIQFVSPGYGLDIRQSMGWTKVCETARSGIWVLKGIARARMFPANLDHLRVE